MQKVISQVKCTIGVSKAVYGVRKANFGLRKQISDCEIGFWTAKTGFGVRKHFLSQAGEFFLPEIRAGKFFLRSLPAPPPIKIKWLLP